VDKTQLKQIRMMDNIRENIIGNSNVKNNVLALEIARKWILRR